jgi:hypothetical protein
MGETFQNADPLIKADYAERVGKLRSGDKYDKKSGGN